MKLYINYINIYLSVYYTDTTIRYIYIYLSIYISIHLLSIYISTYIDIYTYYCSMYAPPTSSRSPKPYPDANNSRADGAADGRVFPRIHRPHIEHT